MDYIYCLCWRSILLSSSSSRFLVSINRISWLANFAFLSLAFPSKNLHSFVKCIMAYFLAVLSLLSLLISLSISSTSLVLPSSLLSSSLISISFLLLLRLYYFSFCLNYTRERLTFGLETCMFVWGMVET